MAVKPKWLLSSLLLAGLSWPAAAQSSSGTPIMVQPPQLQAPADTPLQMPSSIQYQPTPNQPAPIQPVPTPQTPAVPPVEQPITPQPVLVPLTPSQPVDTIPVPGPKQQDLPGAAAGTVVTPFSVAASPEKLVAWGGLRLSTTSWGLNLGASYPVTQLGQFKVFARGLAELGKRTGSATLLALRADAFAEYVLNDTSRIYGGPGLSLGLGASELGLSAGYRKSLNSRLGAFVEGSLSRVWVSGESSRNGFGVRSGLTWRF